MSSSSASVKKSTPEPSSSSSALSLTPVRSFVNDQFSGKDAFYVSSVTIGSVLASYYGTKLIKYVKKVGIKAALFRAVMSIAKTIPGASGAIEAEKQKIAGKMESMIIPKEVYEEKTKYITIPEKGMNSRTLLELMAKWKSSEENRWGHGHVSGGIYHGGSELTEVLTQAYSFFALSNPLHPDVFPYVRKMEAEVIAMTLNLFNGTTPDHCGAMTSGGTESILMAMKSYRERARSKGIERPNIVCAVSAHAAFDKAAHYFDMDIIKVPVDPITFKMDINATKKAINSSTAVIVGSAPGFPHGIIDPISELNELALKHNIGLHVDCCLGSFLVCLLEKIGCPPPPFDFRLSGVSSISCDTHKYGYAPKGSSVVMFNSKELRQYMYFVAADWTGGIYASPTMPGSRPGGLVAATWAALVHIGLEGYLEIGKGIMNASKTIQEGIKKIDGLKIIGKPDMSIIAFTHDPESPKAKSGVLNIFKVGEAMSQRHWVLNTLQKPGAVHICLTKMHVPVVDRFLSDLQWAVDEVVNNPDKFKNGSAAIYGMTESLPDNSLVTDLAKTFIDTLFKPA